VSWQAMQEGNVFYRRQQCYSTPGKLPEIKDYIIAGCRYGGPIGAPVSLKHRALKLMKCLALMRDHTKLLALGRSTPAITKAQIQVYSPAGEGLLVFSVDTFFDIPMCPP
jgi:hypothetical protein